MEITAKPRRRGWWRALRVLVVVAAMWGVALLIPPALGLQTHVIEDRAMAGAHARGALAFDEPVTPSQLAVGDVVTFVPPDAEPGAAAVTRRVVAIGDTHFSTRGDALGAVDPWLVPVPDGDLQRVTFSLPWVGYPMILVGAVTVPPWTPAAVAIGVAAALVLLRRGARPVAEGESAVPEVATATPPLT